MTAGRAARADAAALAGRLLVSDCGKTALEADIAARSHEPLSELFAAQLAKQLRNQDPETTPALRWLEERLALQGVSIDEVVQHAQQRQGGSNVTVRNIVTSMRLISDIDWAELFESVSLVDKRLRAQSDFADMDFPTRDLYRNAIEQLARGSSFSELEIVDRALDAARAAAAETDTLSDVERAGDPGYHLIAQGRPALERAIRFRPSPRLRISRLSTRLGIGGYIGAILLVTAIALTVVLWAMSPSGVDTVWLAAFALIVFLPATEVATALVDRAMSWSFGATILPGLALKQGVPPSLRTLVAVPTLLTSEADLLEQVELLEVHHLSGVGGVLVFALLTDGVDAGREVMEGDAHLLAIAR
jgi:cyclic beta-1,2-glucan synthetase